MGRTLGSPNTKVYHWEFAVIDPLNEKQKLWSKKYCTLPEMHTDLEAHYTFAQIKSYASGARPLPKHVSITKIKENTEYDTD